MSMSRLKSIYVVPFLSIFIFSLIYITINHLTSLTHSFSMHPFSNLPYGFQEVEKGCIRNEWIKTGTLFLVHFCTFFRMSLIIFG